MTTFRERIVSEANGLSDEEDRRLRYDVIDFSEGTTWGLAVALADMRGCDVATAYAVLV
jgi:hypothetical protein